MLKSSKKAAFNPNEWLGDDMTETPSLEQDSLRDIKPATDQAEIKKLVKEVWLLTKSKEDVSRRDRGLCVGKGIKVGFLGETTLYKWLSDDKKNPLSVEQKREFRESMGRAGF